MGRGGGLPRGVIAFAIALVLAPCTAEKNVSVSTSELEQAAPIPSSTPAPVTCSNLPPTIEGEDGDVECVSSASGDLNGDGEFDQFGLYLRASSSIQIDELIAVAKLSGEEELVELKLDPHEPASGPERIEVFGLGDADGDGRDEAFFTLEGGASVRYGSIIALQGNRLTRVRSGSRPFLFGLLGGVRYGNGVECVTAGSAAKFIVRNATSDDDGMTYKTMETEYRWSSSGTTLSYRTRRRGTISGDDPDLRNFWRLRCGKLQVGD